MLEPWVKDGLNQVEVELLEELELIAARPSVQDAGLIADVLLMPLFDTVEASDLGLMAVTELPWVEDGLARDEQEYVMQLQAIGVVSPALFRALMALPWVSVDPSSGDYSSPVIEAFHSIIAGDNGDAPSALKIAGMPFLQSVVLADEEAMQVLADVHHSDPDSFAEFLSHPSVAEGITDALAGLFKSLSETDPEFAARAWSLPWVVDGIDEEESSLIRRLAKIAQTNERFASSAAAAYSDAQDPYLFTNLIRSVYLEHTELVDRVWALPWVIDGITEDEVFLIDRLAAMALSNLPFALTAVEAYSDVHVAEAFRSAVESLYWDKQEFVEMVWSMPWVIDGITLKEAEAIDRIAGIAQVHAGLALTMAAQDWVIDGIDSGEAGFMSVVAHIAGKSTTYDALPKLRSKQHRAISLPLAGDVDIWVMDTTVAPPGEDLLTVIEDTARIAEGFFQEPFPSSDIVLVVVLEGQLHGHHAGSYMVLPRRKPRLVSYELQYVPHETAHYYFASNFQEHWLKEGGSQFIQAYVNDRTGVQTLLDRKFELSEACAEFENIVHWQHHWEQESRGTLREGKAGGCDYDLGEKLLLNILETIGEDAMSAGLNEAYIPRHFDLKEQLAAGRVSDERSYLAFLKHTPEDRKEAFQDLYRRLHGGAFVSE